MFLRCHLREKNGKDHRYWSVVESRRLDDGGTAQRQVLYLGEINDSQEAAWRKSISVFDEDKQQLTEACLFVDDRPIPVDEVNALPIAVAAAASVTLQLAPTTAFHPAGWAQYPSDPLQPQSLQRRSL